MPCSKVAKLRKLPSKGAITRLIRSGVELVPDAQVRLKFGDYLLGVGDCSLPHRLDSDELYHFHLGDPVEMWLLYPDGRAERIVLGGDLASGQCVQAVVPAGAWQMSRLCEGGEYALMSVVVAPGFDEMDYQHGNPADLARQYPASREFLNSLTK